MKVLIGILSIWKALTNLSKAGANSGYVKIEILTVVD